MDSAFWFSFVNINKQVSPYLVAPLFAVLMFVRILTGWNNVKAGYKIGRIWTLCHTSVVKLWEVSFWKEPRIAAVMDTIRFLCLAGFTFVFISQVSARLFQHINV